LIYNLFTPKYQEYAEEVNESFKLPGFNLYATKNYLLTLHQRRIDMNVEQNGPRWFQTKCDCGEIALIDSEEFPGFFLSLMLKMGNRGL